MRDNSPASIRSIFSHNLFLSDSHGSMFHLHTACSSVIQSPSAGSSPEILTFGETQNVNIFLSKRPSTARIARCIRSIPAKFGCVAQIRRPPRQQPAGRRNGDQSTHWARVSIKIHTHLGTALRYTFVLPITKDLAPRLQSVGTSLLIESR